MLLVQDFIEWLCNPEVSSNHFLGTYGVWVVVFIVLIVSIESGVLSPVLSGDSILFAIGPLQNRVSMSLTIIYLVAIVAVIRDGQVGHWFGLLLDEKSLKDDARILKTGYLKSPKAFLSKWGGSAVVLGRLIPFIRTLVSIATGVGRYRWSRLVLRDVAEAIARTPALVVAGVLPDDTPLVRDDMEAIAVIVIVLSVLSIVISPAKKHPDAWWCVTRPHNTIWLSTACGKWSRGAAQARYSS